MTKEDEQAVRRIVREEIVNALGALKREADYQDTPYETAELDSRALGNIAQVAEGVIQRLNCPHERYGSYWAGESRCSTCGEPEPELADPFKEG